MKSEGTISKRYKVTFVRDGVMYKAGDTASVSFPVAFNFYTRGLIDVTGEMLADAPLYGVEFTEKKKKKRKELPDVD